MRLNGFLDAAALRDFLALSQQQEFPFDDRWRRLLTLETAFRTLSRVHESMEA